MDSAAEGHTEQGKADTPQHRLTREALSKSPRLPRPPQPMLEYDRFNSFRGYEEWDGEDDHEPGVLDSLFAAAACPYCGHGLLDAKHFWQDPGLEEGSFAAYELVFCSYCAYWMFKERSYLHHPSQEVEKRMFFARARKFEDLLQEGMEVELAQALRRNPERYADIDPLRFERFVGSVFAANYPGSEVVHVGRTGDGGVDLFLIGGPGDIAMIQVKRRIVDRGEPVETIRSLMGVQYILNELRGIVVSTSTRFTPGAMDLAGLRRGRFELVDRGKLNLMLSPLLPKRPWRQLLEWYKDDLDVGPKKDWVLSRLGGRVLSADQDCWGPPGQRRTVMPKPRACRERVGQRPHLLNRSAPLRDRDVRALQRYVESLRD